MLRRSCSLGSILEKVDALEDKHVEYTVLRACLGSVKLAYILRGLAPSETVFQAMRQADEAMRVVFEKIIGDSVGPAA